jgi:hypothetical protein
MEFLLTTNLRKPLQCYRDVCEPQFFYSNTLSKTSPLTYLINVLSFIISLEQLPRTKEFLENSIPRELITQTATSNDAKALVSSRPTAANAR